MRNQLKKLFLNTDGEVVISQSPNIPITLWFIASLLARMSLFNSVQSTLQVIATLSLMLWAILEVVSGVNGFRRILGGVVLSVLLLSILLN